MRHTRQGFGGDVILTGGGSAAVFWKARPSYRCGEISCFRGLELWACVCLFFVMWLKRLGFTTFCFIFCPSPKLTFGRLRCLCVVYVRQRRVAEGAKWKMFFSWFMVRDSGVACGIVHGSWRWVLGLQVRSIVDVGSIL